MERPQHQPQKPKTNDFYEVFPYAHPRFRSDQVPDETLIEQPETDHEARTTARRILVLLALITAAICLMIIWGVQMAQVTLEPAIGSLDR